MKNGLCLFHRHDDKSLVHAKKQRYLYTERVKVKKDRKKKVLKGDTM